MPKVRVNGDEREVAEGATVRALLDALDLRPDALAVELNREIVPKSEYERRPLRDGDRLEIVGFVGGG